MIVAGGAMTLFTVLMPADWTIARVCIFGDRLRFPHRIFSGIDSPLTTSCESGIESTPATWHHGTLTKWEEIRVKRLLGIVAAGALIIGLAAPAVAMGSGDAYENMQVGVTYTVYEPSFTAGIGAQHVGGNDLCPKGTEQNLMGSLRQSKFPKIDHH